MLETWECLERLLARVEQKRNIITVSLEDAAGYIAAQDIDSPIMVPPFPKAAMDGYAVKSADTVNADKDNPVILEVVGELDAGDYSDAEYIAGTAVRIMTGAFVPKGYDAVIMQEKTDYGEKKVKLFDSVKPYQNYCKIGEDMKAGERLVKKGERLTPLLIGLLAGSGIAEVSVYDKLSVSILASGSELRNPGEELCPGKIYNSISFLLAAQLKQQGIKVVKNELCEDDEEKLFEQIKNAVAVSDIVITTGGVSVGKKDFIPAILKRMEAEILFQGANIQPGTPTLAGIADGVPVLGLSGNPFAAMANFELYFWPMAAKMSGNEALNTVSEEVIADCHYDKANKRNRRLRAYAQNGKVTLPTDEHKASIISNMRECNCFLDVAAGQVIQPGDKVRVTYFKQG